MENEENKLINEQTEKRFCVKCGFQLPQDCDFCPKCGTPRGNVAGTIPKEKKKSKKWIVILIVVIVVVSALAVGACFLFTGDKDEEDVDSSFTYEQLKSANNMAKSAYYAIEEYVADEETMGRVEADVLEEIAGEVNKDGEEDTFEHFIIYGVLDGYGEIYVIYPATVNGRESYVVQWRNTSESGAIGQYPEAVSSVDISVDWGTFCSYDVQDEQQAIR